MTHARTILRWFLSSCWLLMLHLSPGAGACAQIEARIAVISSINGEFSLAIDADFHNRYGVSYPLTFQFDIPSSITGLDVDRKSDRSAAWSPLHEKTATDAYNGIEAFRIDHFRSRVFVSVAFSAASDSLFLRFTASGGDASGIGYRGMPEYYDGRRAAVTVTADDWADWFASMYPPLLSLFRSYGLYVTAGAITAGVGPSTWGDMQRQLDSGYVEIVAHSRTHPAMPYPDPVGEVIGCIDDIRSHLTLPPSFRRGDSSYVYVWIAPNGRFSTTVDTLLRKRNVLVARLYDTGETGFSPWEPHRQQFAPMNPTLEIGAPSWGGGETRIEVLNSAFDSVVARGGVYHFMWHPQTLHPDIQAAYLTNHLAHVSGHADLWYANLGHLYLYHLVQLANAEDVSTVPVAAGLPESFALWQNYPNPFNPSTTIRYGLPVRSHVTLAVFNTLGQQVATLVDGEMEAGDHEVKFDASHLPSGVYLYGLQAGDRIEVRKALLMK